VSKLTNTAEDQHAKPKKQRVRVARRRATPQDSFAYAPRRPFFLIGDTFGGGSITGETLLVYRPAQKTAEGCSADKQKKQNRRTSHRDHPSVGRLPLTSPTALHAA
jgi:hypothetical protein